MDEQYTEYATRNRYSRSDSIQNWVAKRIVENLLSVSRSTPASTKVLEFGSGLGRIAETCVDKGFEKYSAVEPNPTLANETRAKSNNIIVDESYLPYVSTEFIDSYDLALSFHVLEHAPNQYDARNWVEAMISTLKPGGVILVAGPDIRDYGNYFWDSDWSHGYPLTPNRVAQIFNDFNLEILEMTTLHFGSRRSIARITARTISFLIPHRFIDSLTRKIFGRPLATGVSIALLWGITFVVAKKKTT